MASTFTQIPSPTANTAGVTSFTSRDGAVVGQAGDYEADQITYDNGDSGFTATEVQAAIDEAAAQVAAINPAPFVLQATPITEAERDALVPSKGWVIYNDDTDKLQVYNGTAWEDLN